MENSEWEHSNDSFLLFQLAIKLLACSETEMILLASLILVMPALQILSSSAIEDCMSEEDSSTSRKQLAINLLEIVQRRELKGKKKLVMFLIHIFLNPSKSHLFRFAVRIVAYFLIYHEFFVNFGK